MMKKSELEEYDIPNPLIKTMKDLLKSLCSEDPALDSFLRKMYTSNPSDKPKFLALLK